MDIIHYVYVQSSRAQFSKTYINSNDFATSAKSFFSLVCMAGMILFDAI